MASFPDLTTVCAFAMVAVSASTLSNLGRALQLPLITGYIIAGAVAGPYVLNLLSHAQTHSLDLVTSSLSMGFIGFSAGTKFLLSELRGSLKPVLLIAANLCWSSYLVVGLGFWLLTPFLPLTAGYDPAKRAAVALIVACLSVARSPSSAIAIITELGAHGAYTSATLSVTVIMDLVVVLAFAGTTVLVTALVHDLPGHAPTRDPAPGRVLLLFAAQIGVSVIAGVALAFLLHGCLTQTSAAATLLAAAEPAPAARRTWPNSRANKPRAGRGGSSAKEAGPSRAAWPPRLVRAAKVTLAGAETLLVLLCGFLVFESDDWQVRRFGSSFHQPLVVSLVAGFSLANFTASRQVLNRVLHDASEPVYIAFFTLTGARLQLSALLPDLPAAGLIFTLRLLGIFVGSRLGGAMGGAEPAHRDRYWMALVTQAGVTLGLLAQVSKLFPWAQDMATAITATVVMNQLVGPLLYRTAILSVGEAHPAYSPADGARLGVLAVTRPQPRSAVLVSEAGDADARALRLRLERRGWKVVGCQGVGHTAGGHAHATAGGPHTDPAVGPGRGVPDVAAVESKVELGMICGGPGSERERRFGHVLRVARQRGSASPPLPRRKLASLGEAAVGGPRAEPLLGGRDASWDVSGDAAPSLGEWELRLLWAISSLDSLDVLALLSADDDANLLALRHLARSAALLPHLLEWQTTPPQILVRMADADREAEYVEACRPPLRLTLVWPSAALPNLLAEMLHPDAHWSLAVDNAPPPALPAEEPGAGGDVGHPRVGRSRTAGAMEAA